MSSKAFLDTWEMRCLVAAQVAGTLLPSCQHGKYQASSAKAACKEHRDSLHLSVTNTLLWHNNGDKLAVKVPPSHKQEG